jgi:hypothetical protein
MKAKLLVLVTLGVVLGGTMLPARAKGFENATVTITGPGLGAPIRLRGDDAFTYGMGSGFDQLKWDAPNVRGTLKPDADLGPAYTAVVRMGCDGSGKASFTQTIYPEAEGGVQILTPEGSTWCFGLDVPSGYWAASSDMEALLAAHGVSVDHAQEVRAQPARVAAVTPPDRDNGSAGLVGLVVGLLLVLGAGAFVIVRRRGSHAAHRSPDA